MENIINHLNEFKYIYLTVLGSLLIIIILLILWHKKESKVKPIQLEEIEKNEQPTKELEDVIAALENTQNSRPMTTFEQEQEENAIISYQELVAAVQEKKSLMQDHKEIPNEKIEPDHSNNVIEEKPTHKFKNSEFISPVFGKDTKTNDDFLKELKDFRRNL